MKKSKFLLLFCISLLLVSLFPLQALAVDDPVISAEAAVLMDADSGEVYFELNADDKRAPASTTKIMTALLVIEAIENGQFTLDDSVAAYDDCMSGLDDDSSTANPAIEPGEILSIRDLLHCAMLVSANEACNILAEYTAGSIDGFVDNMNARANELGCTDTNFTNPSGLESGRHQSTARDMAIITRECVSHELFVELCSASSYTVDATNVSDSRELTNTNALVNPDSRYYNADVYGVKTGYLESAGCCLIAAIEKNDVNLISVILGDVQADGVDCRYPDTLTLFDWLFENYSFMQVLSSTDSVVKVPVALATEETVSGRPDTSINALLPNDFDLEDIEYEYVIYSERDADPLVAPVNAGTILGEVTVRSGDREFGTVSIVATNTAELSKGVYLKSAVKSILQESIVRKLLTILIIVVAIYIVLSFFYVVQHSRHRRSLQRARQARMEQQTVWEMFPDALRPEDEAEEPEAMDPESEEELPAEEDYEPAEPRQSLFRNLAERFKAMRERAYDREESEEDSEDASEEEDSSEDENAYRS